MILTSDYISTFVIGEDGLLSTINDDFNITFPPDSITTTANSVETIVINDTTITVPVWNASVLSSIIIKPGTVVSTIIQAGNIITTSATSILNIPVYAPCTVLFDSWNQPFWNRTFENEQFNSTNIKNQILYFEPYYQQLQQAHGNDELQFEIYKNKIYPKFKKVWSTFATSGFAQDIFYLGRNPGVNKTQNIGNTVFPTIAALQNIEGLISQDQNIQTSILYLSRHLFDNINYYLNLVTKDILAMYSYTNGIPVDGWRKKYIQFKGYNTFYQQSDNTTKSITYPNKKIDVDGPWVYSALQVFIKLYLQQNKFISYDKIKVYVLSYFYDLEENELQDITQKIFVFQHKIFNNINYIIYNYHTDSYGNQYILYKYNEFNRFEDSGQIWVRYKNYPLALPLMNLNKIYQTQNVYVNDKYDMLHCDINISYANMFKQLVNNALDFGIIQNVLWIIGRTTWVDSNGILRQNTQNKFQNFSYLKLICISFYNQNNKLKLDLTTYKSIRINSNIDYLNSINQFVGVYLNQINKTLDIVLYNKEKHISNIKQSKQQIIFQDIWNKLKETNIPFIIYSYNLSNNNLSDKVISLKNTQFPIADFYKQQILIEIQHYINSKVQKKRILQYLNLELSGTIIIQNIQYNAFGNLNILNNDLILSGTILNYKNSIITGIIPNTYQFISFDDINFDNVQIYFNFDNTITTNRYIWKY